MKYIILLFILLFSTSISAYNERYGWPSMAPPKDVIICRPPKTWEETMLLESLSGLAAQAVNKHKFNKMIWIDTNNISYKRILEQSLKALSINKTEEMDVWELLDYLRKKKIVKGYILFNKEKCRNKNIKDYSSNVATIYSSTLSGVLIESSLESKAKKLRLIKLKDARRETMAECFNKNKSLLSNCSALSIHPNTTNMRDYAIANKLMLFADEKELTEDILEWVKPLSPILGWGCGDEFDATSIISEYGHYNTASDWCINLPFISSAAPYIKLEKAKEIKLSNINFADSTYVHSYVMSDGDNMQWTMGNFIDNPLYAGHKNIKDLGISWTLCPINLSIVSPVSWNEIVKKQNIKNSIIEYGGGYQYPDLFAIKRENRKELLREFAKRINIHLKKLDVKIFGALFKDVNSKEAQEAMQIYAEEFEEITGMIAIQYFPYELGKKLYWYKNKKGYDIPMITADYSLWNEVNDSRPNCGTPEYISSLINRDMLLHGKNNYSWTIVHAWSDFSKTSKTTTPPAKGVNPIKSSENLLLNDIRTVSLNELLWRVRIKYKNEQIAELLN